MGLRSVEIISEEASRVTSELFSEIITGTTESLNYSIDGNMTVGDVCMESSDFICGQYAHTISGIFAWSALLMACFQVSSVCTYMTSTSISMAPTRYYLWAWHGYGRGRAQT